MLLRSVLFCMIFCAVYVTKVKGDESIGPKPKLPDDKLFKDQAAFCEGCYGMVSELYSLLKKWDKKPGPVEDHIDAAFISLCTNDRLRAYVLSPPKMTRLCSGLLAHYRDEIAEGVMRVYGTKEKPTKDLIFNAVCRKNIPACPKNMEPMSVNRKKSKDNPAADPVMADKVIKGGETIEVSVDKDGNPITKKKKQQKEEKETKKTKNKSNSKDKGADKKSESKPKDEL